MYLLSVDMCKHILSKKVGMCETIAKLYLEIAAEYYVREHFFSVYQITLTFFVTIFQESTIRLWKKHNF
jgi:hypothetical protein